MSEPEYFELVLTKIANNPTVLGSVAATLTFSTTLKDAEALEKLRSIATSKPLKFFVYGSFEDEVAMVLREDRDQWRKKAQALEQQVAYLRRQLEEAQETRT